MARTVGVSRCAVGQPALGELVEARRVGDGEDDVVLLDDALVEAVGLLAGEAERGLEDRLLAQPLDLERRAEGEVREDADGDEDRRQEHEAGEARGVRASRLRREPRASRCRRPAPAAYWRAAAAR